MAHGTLYVIVCVTTRHNILYAYSTVCSLEANRITSCSMFMWKKESISYLNIDVSHYYVYFVLSNTFRSACFSLALTSTSVFFRRKNRIYTNLLTFWIWFNIFGSFILVHFFTHTKQTQNTPHNHSCTICRFNRSSLHASCMCIVCWESAWM